MKMKINKACDLSSMSVLPPHARRSSGVLPSGPPQSSQQLRSQASQQSFSQGHSSQPGMFSQLSQNSLEEAVMTDQRLNSQERESSVKRISCLAPTAFRREESQMPLSRSSTTLMHKWNPTTVSDHRCRISEELEHKIGVIETSMNKFGMILDSIQSDIMQANKGTKEVSLELDGIRQKLTSNDNLLQLMSKGQADLKGNYDEGLKSIRDLLSKNVNQERVKETLLTLSALPERIEAYLLKTKRDLCNAFTAELKEISCSLKNSHKKCIDSGFDPPKDIHCSAASKKRPPVKMDYNAKRRTKECMRTGIAPKIEMGSWTSVKREQNTLTDSNCIVKYKQKSFLPIQQENAGGRVIESDEDIGGGLSFLLEVNDTGARNSLVEEARVDTKRILREARRRKRKYSNPIIID